MIDLRFAPTPASFYTKVMRLPASFITVFTSVALFGTGTSSLWAQNNSPAPAPGNLNLWEMILSVGWILVPLALLSILVITLIVFNFLWLRESNIASLEFLDDARHNLKTRKLEDLIETCRRHKGACPKVVGKVVEFAKDNPETGLESLKEIAEAEGSRLAARISRPNLLLMDLGVMSPMVGLLGTVVGILRSFGNIASDNTPMKTVVLAGGVSQALMATAIGLIVGLTAMLFYAYFRGRVQVLVTFFETTLVELQVKTHNCMAKGR